MPKSRIKIRASTPTRGGLRSDMPFTVVLADDDDLVLETIVMMLTAAGIRAIPCVTGEQAVAKVREEMPDAVLLDINMPGFGGLGAAREMRQIPGMDRRRIVALTGRATNDVRDAALAADFDAFLSKPTTQHSLLEALLKPRIV